ncbi:MAG: CHAD domain-containing protein, partial [Sphingomonadaceae bacterium]|nr:CHAD domain-containing protein [Sphingomonadaceae bacterium]
AAEVGAAAEDPDLGAKTEAFRESLAAARERAGGWTLDEDGFAPAAEGMARIYGEGRAFAGSLAPGATDEAFHEWRKRVKYHWQHARLLKLMQPEAIEPHAAAAGALAALLGEHHDLAVLRAHLADAPEGYARADALLVVEALIERRRIACEDEIFEGAGALFKEKPGALARRWSGYWEAWRAAPLAEAA